jgi:nitric oxide reductase large subunit
MNNKSIISINLRWFLAGMIFANIAGQMAYSMLSLYMLDLGASVVQGGLAFGFFGTSLGLLSLPMPWIGAQLWERISPQTPFWIVLAASLISVIVAWMKFKLPKSDNPPQPQP